MKPRRALAALVDANALVPVSLLLFLAAMIAPGSRTVEALQGKPRIECEFQVGETCGYYESILNAAEPGSLEPSNQNKANAKPSFTFVPFGASNIVEVIPTYLRWRIRPSLDLCWNGTTFRSSSLGYRTPEIDLKKPRNVYRILVFGSSNTMGHGVDDDVVYPRLLEDWLNEQVNPPIHVEVVNLAVSGDSPSRRLQRLREEAGRFQADWILCDASPLDYPLEEDHLETIIHSEPPVEIPFEFVREALARAEVSAADSREAFRLKLRGEIEELLEGSYAGWKVEADRLGIPLTMVILPRADRKLQSPRIVELILSMAGLNGIDVIDLSSVFGGFAVSQFRVSERDKHPSALGHRALFDGLQTQLLQRGGLPGLSLPQTHQAQR
jgi:hypothetical protein